MDMAGALNNRLLRASLALSGLSEGMTRLMKQKIESCSRDAERYAITLRENDPRRLLAKGFAFVSGEDGKPVGSASLIKKGERYRMTFSDGYAEGTVDKTEVGKVMDYDGMQD